MRRSGPPTIGQIHAAGDYQIRGCCNDCQHSEYFDLAALVERLGPDYVAIDLNGRMKCTKCGSRRSVIKLQPVHTGPT